MNPATAHSPQTRPRATTFAGLAAAALVSAVIPAAAGLAFLSSLAARRPLIAVAARRWPWVTGRPAPQPHRRALTGLTAAWGIGLLAAAAVQGAGALTGGLTFTSPRGFAARALTALTAEAILAAATIAWLHRSPPDSPTSGKQMRDKGDTADNPCSGEARRSRRRSISPGRQSAST